MDYDELEKLFEGIDDVEFKSERIPGGRLDIFSFRVPVGVGRNVPNLPPKEVLPPKSTLLLKILLSIICFIYWIWQKLLRRKGR